MSTEPESLGQEQLVGLESEGDVMSMQGHSGSLEHTGRQEYTENLRRHKRQAEDTEADIKARIVVPKNVLPQQVSSDLS